MKIVVSHCLYIAGRSFKGDQQSEEETCSKELILFSSSTKQKVVINKNVRQCKLCKLSGSQFHTRKSNPSECYVQCLWADIIYGQGDKPVKTSMKTMRWETGGFDSLNVSDIQQLPISQVYVNRNRLPITNFSETLSCYISLQFWAKTNMWVRMYLICIEEHDSNIRFVN